MIHLEHVSRTFREKSMEVHALQDVSLQVRKGEIYGIVGFSGAGKSTLIRLVNRLETPDTGTVTVGGKDLSGLNGRELTDLRRKIGMVFQQFNLLEGKTVAHNIAIPLRMAGRPKEEIDRRVAEVLDFVELSEKKEAYVSQLSGGQKQRVGIARALATEPEILLCDEATSALDPQTTESILKLLKRVNQEMGITIMLITHQMQVIQMICDRVAVMEDGRIVEEGNVLDVFGRPQAEVTKRFVRTVINDQIPETFYETIRSENRHYRLEQLKFIGDTVNEPVIANLILTFHEPVNILRANTRNVGGVAKGEMVLQFMEYSQNTEAMKHYLEECGLAVEEAPEYAH